MAKAPQKLAGLFIIFFTIAVDQLRLPMVNCQEDIDTTQCLPKKTFIAFLRLPEVSSNLAAYSRTARIIQSARNDFINLKILGKNNDDDNGKICIPPSIYYEIFSDPKIRAHFDAIERAQKMLEIRDVDSFIDTEKKSIATLAKNDDLPITTVQEREQKNQDDEEKRSQAGMTPEELVKVYDGDTQEDKTSADVIDHYTLPNGDLDVEAMSRDYHNGKRNIATLARDYALPERRNIGSVARQYGLSYGKRNIATLARDKMIPNSGGKRTVPLTYGRYMWLKGKRNVGSLARDFALPSGKRNISYLAKNGWLNIGYQKRNVGTLARDWNLPQTRTGRSSIDDDFNYDDKINKQYDNDLQNIINQSQARRQSDYSDEYPTPVMQNKNLLDYEDFIEALADVRYPVAEKRFMDATGDSWQDDDDDDETLGYRPSKRHIGALARLGWLPTFRAARFSRSPRWSDQEDSTDGTSSNNTPNSSSRLGINQSDLKTRYVQTLKGDCRHGFKRYLLIPTNHHYLDGKIRFASMNI
ncbi:hypothetical protein HCN44_004983 [Aphidius gifuensis]|uniref:Neuropeptide-like 1 n=1 Tax=Aphidius gifuensis TaxID=684658 RepID=A0A835CQ86_APHGI|nr:hypothetical protein HCN44_004983 [Aphidius gifuensis]